MDAYTDLTNISKLLGKVGLYYTWIHYPRIVYGLHIVSFGVNILCEVALIAGDVWWFPTKKSKCINYISDASISLIVQTLHTFIQIYTFKILVASDVHLLIGGGFLFFTENISSTFRGWGHSLATSIRIYLNVDDYKRIICEKFNDLLKS